MNKSLNTLAGSVQFDGVTHMAIVVGGSAGSLTVKLVDITTADIQIIKTYRGETLFTNVMKNLKK
jgi:hypothetical protein